MAGKGGPYGNQNAKHGTWFRDALNKALAQDREALFRVAKKLIKMAEDGEIDCIRELANRLDGRVPQAVVVDGGPNDLSDPRRFREVQQLLLTVFSKPMRQLPGAGQQVLSDQAGVSGEPGLANGVGTGIEADPAMAAVGAINRAEDDAG